MRTVLILMFASLLLSVTTPQGVESDQILEDYRENSVRAAPRDAFPVLYNPDKATVKEADRHLDGTEWIIGVEINGKARAYPVAVMGVHELINDTVSGQPITVCW